MRKTFFFFIINLFFISILLICIGCEKEREKPPVKAIISNISHKGCKDMSTRSTTFEGEYIAYKTVDKNYLSFKHVNAEFNCCPEKLLVDFTVKNNIITITEKEKVAGCKCLCNYDLSYTIGALPYGKYEIVIHKNEVQEFARFTIDFSANTEGKQPISHTK